MTDFFKVKLENYPHLKAALNDPARRAQAVEVLKAFVRMADEAFNNASSGVAWVDLPKQFHPDLTFEQMISDILHGILDLKGIDPEFWQDLGPAVHPFGLFSYRPPNPDGPTTFYDWQNHFQVDPGSDKLPPIQAILRKLMYYARYIEIEKLAQALFHNHIHTYIAERDPSSLIPIQPALRYQREVLGELAVGQFYEEIGFLKGGPLPEEAKEGCPACKVPKDSGLFIEIKRFGYKACLKCGIAFKIQIPIETIMIENKAGNS